MTPAQTEHFQFAERLAIAVSDKGLKHSPTVIGNLFNLNFHGRSITTHTARNWMLGKSMPTQDKLLVLAILLDTSAEHLRYGRHSEKTLTLQNADGMETELTISQQQLVRKYIMLSATQQRLVNELVDEITG